MDCDGVLCDFNKSFMRRMVAMTGRDLFGPGYEPTTWNYPESVGYTAEEVDAMWKAIKADRIFWYSLERYADTATAIEYLADRIYYYGDDVYFITARPGEYAKSQTERWLLKEFGFASDRPILPTVLISSHKGLCAQALGLDVYIDDRWDNCMETASMHWKRESPNCRTYLMDRPWNQGHEDEIAELGITRVRALPGICDPVPNSVPTPRRNTSDPTL